MSLEMSHDDAQAMLAAEALGALEPGDRDAVLRHAEGCAECAAELRSLRDTADLLAWAAPARPMEPARSDRLRARLVARAAADRDASLSSSPSMDGASRSATSSSGNARARADAVASPIPTAPSADVVSLAAQREMRDGRRGGAGWMAAAAAVVLAVGLGAYALTLRGRVDDLDRRLAAAEDARVQAEDAVAQRDQTLTGLTGAAVRVIDLAATGGRAPSGRMFWDPSSDTWRFFAHSLPAVAADREYQLWLITPGRRISAGTFRPGADGRAHVAATFALPADSLRAIAVTEEPAGGMPQPTGTPLIVGALAD